MKKLFNLLGLCILAIACKQSPDKSTLTASGLTVIDDIYVYDAANHESIDTIKVVDGAFSYTFGNIVEPKLLLMTDTKDFMRYFIGENGHLTMVGDTGVVTGGALNKRLNEFSEAYQDAGREITNKKIAIFNKAQSEGREMNDEELSKLDVLDKEQVEALSGVIKKYFAEDRNNIMGVLQLKYYQHLVPEEDFFVLYEQGGDVVKNYPSFLQQLEEKVNREKTQPGGKYIDVEGINPKDVAQTLKLSDYAGKDKYVLIDFWASWCGPCKAAMPEIKKLNDKYAGKGLEVIGLVVGDKIEDHLAAAKSLNVTWPQIFDNKDVASSAYGIKGIPTLILLDKEGTILLRTYDKNLVKEKIESLLGK